MPDELNVTLEDDSPVIEVQIIGTGPVGPAGGPGPAGPEGPAGVGVPSGGTTRQALKKRSDTDYDTEWADESGVDADGAAVAAGAMVDYWGEYGDQTLAPGSTQPTYVGFVRHKTTLTCNGTAGANGDLRVRLNGQMQRTQGTGTIDGWAGMEFETGHTYAVTLNLLSGTVVPNGSDPEPSISIYRSGYHTSSGQLVRWNGGGMRVFTAQAGERYNIAFYVESSTALTDAVYEIKCVDITNDFADVTTAKRLYTSTTNETIEGGVVVDGIAYSYSLTSNGIVAVDLRSGARTNYPMAMGHGNDMTYYNGKLYVLSMEATGRIYIIDKETMTQDGYVDFEIDGVPTISYGIAWDSVGNRFVLKIDDAFAFADASLSYTGQVPYVRVGTSTHQGMECDGVYIYLPMSSLNQINVFDMTGAFVKSICVYGNADEPEALSLRDGAWYLLTNIPGSNKVWYWDAITLKKRIEISDIFGLLSWMR